MSIHTYNQTHMDTYFNLKEVGIAEGLVKKSYGKSANRIED